MVYGQLLSRRRRRQLGRTLLSAGKSLSVHNLVLFRKPVKRNGFAIENLRNIFLAWHT